MKLETEIVQKGSINVDGMAVESISIDSIIINYHPRKALGDQESLTRSISKLGLQKPLSVYPVGEKKYAVIDGQRRLDVCRKMGIAEVPCITKNVDESTAASLSYALNTERNSLTPIEEALHFRYMQEQFGFTLEDLYINGHGTSASISQKLQLLDLPESVQKKIANNTLTPAHGREIRKLPSADQQEKMAKRVIDHDLSAKRTKIRISRYLAKIKNANKPPKRVHVPKTDIPGVFMKDNRDMSEIPDESVALVVGSPNYGLDKEFEKGMPLDVVVEENKQALKECARVIMPGGLMALNIGDIHNYKGKSGKNNFSHIELMGHKYQAYLRPKGMHLIGHIIRTTNKNWDANPSIIYSEKTEHTDYQILHNYDHLYIYKKKGKREIPPEDVVLRSRLTKAEWAAYAPGVWHIKPVKDQSEHPTPFPEEMVRRVIKMYSYEDDTVLDPWLGSGTTVKIARELNRTGMGYERNLRYKTVIMKKLGMDPETEKPSLSIRNYVEEQLKTVNQTSDLNHPPIEADTPAPHILTRDVPSLFDCSVSQTTILD